MRIAVVGAGGVGGGFGAALAKASADVTFIARGAHLAAMKSTGLKVESPRGDSHLVPTQATDDPKTVGPVDVVLFCVKLWDVESAGQHIKPQISASIVAPGVIRQIGTFMRMAFGELDGGRSKRGEEFLALCQKAGFDAALSEQIVTELWMKFILLATNASVMALARQPIGKLRDDPDMKPHLVAAYKEVIDVGRARGVKLPADALNMMLAFNAGAPPAMKASMALDLERGNRIELPWLGGKVVELGRQLGVATPTHALMYAALKPYVMGTSS